MALSRQGSREKSGPRYRLHATHNPTETSPSFLLPIFRRLPDANALYLQRVSLDSEVIFGFETISDQLKLVDSDEGLTTLVDRPVIHAFEMPSEDIIVGTRSQLSPELAALASSRSLFNLPSLRLDLVEFCSLSNQISEAAHGVYRFLQSVSSFSADYWRDRSFLAERARRNLQKYIADQGIDLGDWRQLDDVTLSIRNGRPVLACPVELYDILKSDIDWDAWVESIKKSLQFHIGAFAKPSQLRLVVGSDDRSSGEEPLSSIAMNLSHARWLVAAFGKTAVSATNEVRRRGLSAVHIDTSRGWTKETSRLFSAAQRVGRHEAAKPLNLLVVMSSSGHDAEEISYFLEALPKGVRPYAVVLHRTQDGLPSEEREYELFRSKKFERIIVITDNDFPIGEASSKTSSGTLLVSLIGTLDRILDSNQKVPRGRSVFSMAWTRYGLRGYEAALSRSLAAAANPWVSITDAEKFIISLSSVGRPDGGFSDDVTHQLNQTLFGASGKERTGSVAVEAKWIQRRFMPGGNIPATIELLATHIADERRTPDNKLAEAAKIILASAGYEVMVDRTGSLSISNNAEDRLLIAIRDISRSKTPDVYVQLMPDKRSQKEALAQHDAWKIALPLMLGDLHFLGNVQDPLWTATLLAHLAQPKKLWRDIWKEFIQQTLQREMRRNENYRNRWLKDLPRSAAVIATTIEIERTERLAGRQAKVFGTMTADFSLSGAGRRGRSERSRSAEFELKFGPDEFSVVRLELAS